MERELKERSSSRAQIILNSLGIGSDGAAAEGVVELGAQLRAASTKGDCARLRELLCIPSSLDTEALGNDLGDAGLQAALEQKDKLGNVCYSQGHLWW